MGGQVSPRAMLPSNPPCALYAESPTGRAKQPPGGAWEAFIPAWQPPTGHGPASTAQQRRRTIANTPKWYAVSSVTAALTTERSRKPVADAAADAAAAAASSAARRRPPTATPCRRRSE
eukprot:354212-Chlamydomonas_euryale.AAC.5